MKKDTRRLVLFESEFRDYSASGAMVSYGDVVDFVHGRKEGIFLADTCGHSEHSGRMMSEFIRKEIGAGWGVEGDAEHNLVVLGKKLASMRAPGVSCFDCDEWFSFVSASYTQFDGENISLAMGGGLGQTLILRSSGLLERILMLGGTIDNKYHLGAGMPSYPVVMDKDDVLFLQSDGLVGNIGASIYDDVKMGKICFDTRYALEYIDAFLLDVLGTNSKKHPAAIRDSLVDRFRDYFLPRSLRDDDVTFVVVKRK